MKKSSILRQCLRTTMLSGFAAVMAAPVYAQDDNANDDEDLIVVTGTRIAQTSLNGPTPVQVFDNDLIDARGVTNVADLLFGVSTAGPGLTTENATLAQGAGFATFDNRGLGASSTLVLVNGRRAPTIPLGGSGATDINSLPFKAIDRVEFLNGSASAVYGSDAIGGVINVITKQDYEGISLEGQWGTAEVNGGTDTSLSAVGGVSSDRGSVTATIEWRERTPIAASERPLVRSAVAPDGTDGRSPTGFPGTWLVFRDDEAGSSEAIPFPGCPEENLRSSSFASVGFDCAYDFAPLYQAIPYTESLKATTYLQYDIADNINVWGDVRLARTFTRVRNGAAPAFFLVPFGEQGNPFTQENPGDVTYAVRRTVDAGPRSRDARNWTLSAAVGASWDFAENHSVDAYFQRSYVDLNQLGVSGNISASGLTQAVTDGTFQLTQLNPQDVIDSVSIVTFRDSILDEDILNLNFTGEFPVLDSFFINPIQYAIGGEYRESSFADNTDIAQITGDIAGGAASSGGGGRDIYSAYGEFQVNPHELVELKAAVRYDYITNITDEHADKITYQFGAAINPVPWATIRGGYGTGFRAPSLGQLYLGRSFGVTRAVDTTFCNQVTADPSSTPEQIDTACRRREIRSVTGGNPELQPEESKSWNVGVILQLDDAIDTGSFQNTRLSVDFNNISVKGKVGTLSVQEILNNEDLFPQLVNRVGGQLSSLNSFVRSDFQNLNQERGRFIDLVFTTDFDAGNVGVFNADVRVTHELEYLRQTSALQPLCDDAGTTSEPKWRAAATFGWSDELFGANATLRYLGSTTDLTAGRVNQSCAAQNDATRKVDSYVELGLRAYWNMTETARVTFGVNNVTDETPPFSEVAGGGWPWYDQALYSNIGRSYYVNLSKDF